MTRTVICTCSVGNYDWIHPPRITPPGMDFVRFSDRKPLLPCGWTHKDLPELPPNVSERLASRLVKICPQDTFPDHDIAVWVDASIEILGDLTPAIQTFIDTGADVAFFPHPSGRTVGEELDFATLRGRIPPNFADRAAEQRARYTEAGVLDRKIVEATVIFYQLKRPALRAASQTWWGELNTYTERDQISQPFAMQVPDLVIHHWDWHFDDPNPYFRRLPHRPGDTALRLKTGAHYLGDRRLDYRMVRYAIRAAGGVRRAARSILDLPK